MSVQVLPAATSAAATVVSTSTSLLKEEASLPLTPPDSPSSDDECQKNSSKVLCDSAATAAGGATGCHLEAVPSEDVLIESEETEAEASCAPPDQVSRKTGHAENDSAARHGSGETVCVMQQKGGAQPPQNSCPTSMPLKSVLKRSGQRSRGYRVSINESKNEVLEADYVILVRDEEEPQLISIKALDFNHSSNEDQVTLSPPEGYKDAFGYSIHHHHAIEHHEGA